ncbi:valine--tRNA ligase [Candidatus Giovannonibacteria bacterium RIFCSPHIGHO2_02_43_13]|uniref:Valine--tRNA ligase n=1 Tax=Candidatus Giovannonibacteria bacterium RIFCSPHIGHO2_02_43_13 TaxID=1798330 RepID=A0A1F5WT77_9BACT|nr:MAG: Valyl-tRNA synthetase [Parcubacteria group bacterium GW2011_GWA2_44_13]OGF73246.1 MAG: valine--tRNA ligase [Candidatus Giovannonibacteria bacterium RIFCSPHIGHO2_12_FULL_44_42]OGF78501.1 MAG: valine--tRNA ligase [Candidatus Giovannonibacteria bacterium RIFCSPHIGHO2_02_43_13]OGF89849.1 MAG: valine--tRNA ligase [Candidatus Giovannonibacteria bacterium RIFCSPLOWO2_02_FULL_43_54]OGF96691.1 MAG: valine--tRNA ligase [Candidatus Giovannonibacteria bacterium RIFCSPLOWO2_12_FULL_44_32]
MSSIFDKPYDPKEHEENIYRTWEESGFFDPDKLPPPTAGQAPNRKKPFTIIMPPPNANGHLHAGHTLFITLEDIMIRFERMRGKKALWVPGADHAGFETQIVYERELEKQGRSRFGMDHKKLYEEILAFTLENKKYMEADVRAMGASCDWSREKFTLDEDIIRETQRTFKQMFDDGLVYRGSRIINWCPKHQTSLSDVETEFSEQSDPFYFIKYGPFIIATARPETKFGDKYVVIHPKDERYKEYTDGQKLEVEWINGKITATVIKDEAIDMAFGTGVMTITPWHDAIDFEIAERHGLEKEQIIDWRGKLLPIAGEFAGMKIKEARPKIVEKLKEKGLLVKIDENYKHNVRACYKCENTIEPQIKEQWFVKMKPLAKLAIDAVEAEKIKFIPENYKKIFLYWMENTIDWNISRQIVWGIKIPAWFHKPKCAPIPGREKEIEKCENIKISADEPRCEHCNAKYIQDPDTFDTWFSSGQWPYLVLGYPDNPDFKAYFPTDIMETGHDLIFRWVPRMVIFGLYRTKNIPFHTVYLHGLVNDAKGKKMSKSKGNVINPLELSKKYGTDALRIGLIVGNTPGTDLALSEDRIRGYKNFANKIWNAARFVLINTGGIELSKKPALQAYDQQLIDELNLFIKDMTSDMENFKYYLAAEKIYHYFWHTFADKIIEEAKNRLKTNNDEAVKISTKWAVLEIFATSLQLLHPFMPFITEKIWQELSGNDIRKANRNLLMVEEWPQ